MIDKFRVNWTEKVRENNVKKVLTSITGFSYQIDDWMKSYYKQYDPTLFGTKKIDSTPNSDGTLTVIFSRTENPKENNKT
jgi:hypothetical protein